MGFEALFTVNFLVFCLAVAGITEICNRLITFFILDNPKYKATRTSKFWKNVIFPSVPVILGVSIAVISGDYAFPEGTSIFNGRIMLGVVAGISSGYALRLLHSTFNKYGAKVIPESEKAENKPKV